MQITSEKNRSQSIESLKSPRNLSRKMELVMKKFEKNRSTSNFSLPQLNIFKTPSKNKKLPTNKKQNLSKKEDFSSSPKTKPIYSNRNSGTLHGKHSKRSGNVYKLGKGEFFFPSVLPQQQEKEPSKISVELAKFLENERFPQGNTKRSIKKSDFLKNKILQQNEVMRNRKFRKNVDKQSLNNGNIWRKRSEDSNLIDSNYESILDHTRNNSILQKDLHQNNYNNYSSLSEFDITGLKKEPVYLKEPSKQNELSELVLEGGDYGSEEFVFLGEKNYDLKFDKKVGECCVMEKHGESIVEFKKDESEGGNKVKDRNVSSVMKNKKELVSERGREKRFEMNRKLHKHTLTLENLNHEVKEPVMKGMKKMDQRKKPRFKHQTLCFHSPPQRNIKSLCASVTITHWNH
jgi:hypothetical protein